MTTLHTTYFGPVSWYRKLANASGPLFIDSTERFAKQTVRSRCEIATANGLQTLSVPITYNNGDLVTDVRISDHNNWRHLHWQALSSAYGSSPFFEFYADDIHPFFEKKWIFLYDYNMEILHTMCDLIGIHPDVVSECSDIGQGRAVYDARREALAEQQHPYYQTFQQRHGFLPNLSILDLLFNKGPEAVLHLYKL